MSQGEPGIVLDTSLGYMLKAAASALHSALEAVLRPLGEQLQAGVVGDRHAERPQHGLQGRVQGARGRLQQVPQRCVQLDSGLALTHVSSLTYIGVCQKTDIP